MTQASLITDYLSVLSAQLPAPLVEELADGLDETQQHYLTQGLTPDAAAGAAVAEFGEPQVIVAAFIRQSPARHAARRLLAAGPVVGGCWAAALITGRAWTWPVPATVRLLFRCSADHRDWLARCRSVRTAVPYQPAAQEQWRARASRCSTASCSSLSCSPFRS